MPEGHCEPWRLHTPEPDPAVPPPKEPPEPSPDPTREPPEPPQQPIGDPPPSPPNVPHMRPAVRSVTVRHAPREGLLFLPPPAAWHLYRLQIGRNCYRADACAAS
jgi:hypothetical protein